MRLYFTVAAFCIAALLLAAPPAYGQASQPDAVEWKIGPRLTIDGGDIDDTALGGMLRVRSPSFPVQGSGALDLYLSEGDATVFTIDLNGQVPVEIERWFVPYLGAGIGITRISGRAGGGSTTDVGLNLMGGAEVDLGFVNPFVQGQVTIGDQFDRLGISTGLLFNL